MVFNYLIVFTISLYCIALELFLTRILSVKTWNHLVYLIIPFALLGYGIGANIYLVFSKFFNKLKKNDVIAFDLVLVPLVAVVCVSWLIHLRINLDYLLKLGDVNSVAMLLASYCTVFIPFIPIGFLIVYIFSVEVPSINKLYFSDLLGAGAGAALFTALINYTAVFHSILLLSALVLCLFLLIFLRKRKVLIITLFLFMSMGAIHFIDEPARYAIDESKGWWEWPANFLKEKQYEIISSQWHPLGRTEVFHFNDRNIRKIMLQNAYFKINLSPAPDFFYSSTNGMAGTPVFNLSDKGLARYGSQIKNFSQALEVPYTVLNKPKVVVIGTGGGRDIFIAKAHQAREIVGAEINPAHYRQMMPGGKLYGFSGKIYTQEDVRVFNIDGRHFVKTLKAGSYDLVVLNGVDTFSGLVNGAYTYAESYLYTKDAFVDYLRVLKDDGMLNLDRRFFPEKPREELRLFAIALDALKSGGAARPWEHIIMGGYQKWSIILLKKKPFTSGERAIITKYLTGHETEMLFPTPAWASQDNNKMTVFEKYVQSFQQGKKKDFERSYPYDVSVITDNNPFFYKYYKFNVFDPFHVEKDSHTGSLIFITQILVLIQAVFFIAVFLFLPLLIFKKSGIKRLPVKAVMPFVVYFSCLGVGFMFIEIPLMQKFVLLLGSPIYSISVTLTALLIFSGIGSFLLPYSGGKGPLLTKAFVLLTAFLVFLIVFGTPILENFIQYSFPCRAAVVCLTLLPLGVCLGLFFPSGLQLVGIKYPETVAWAWGINSGFSVLGSILAIILAQFLGFNFVLTLAIAAYFVAIICVNLLKKLI